MSISLSQLEYLLAVNKYRHFGKAARACAVTQPTLSMQVQKAEERLGLTLFDRSKSPACPTPEGQRIIEQARAVLREQERLLELADELKGEVGGTFRLGVIPTLAPYLLPAFLRQFSLRYPKVELSVEELQTELIVERLKDDRLDGALLVTPLPEPSLLVDVLFLEGFVLFVSPDHPLSDKSQVRQEDLNLDALWLLRRGHCFRDQVLNICADRPDTAPGGIRFESDNLETLRNMVVATSGYTILPQLASERLPAHQRKLVRPFRPPIPAREVSLVYTRRALKQRILEAIRTTTLETAPRSLGQHDRRDLSVVPIAPPSS